MEKRLDLKEKIAAGISARREDLIALTQDLIRIPTLNPPGENYRLICEYLGTRLKASGFETEFLRAHGYPGDSDQYPRWNIVARREGKHAGECVHFNSHTDIVEVGLGWTKDPFGGELEDGKIYGRGTCDMKGGLSTSIIAAEVFIDLFPDFSGAIEISGTADEETGGYGGVAFMAEKGYFSPDRVQHVIIPEPLNKERICLGHRGAWWAEIETFGEIAHGSMPFLGDCAVRHMGAVMLEMEESLFPTLAQRRTDLPVVPDGARNSTLNINSVHGGLEELASDYTGLPSPLVPDSCRMVIDRRFLPEENLEDVRAEIVDLLEKVKADRPEFSYEIRGINEILPSMTKRDAPVVSTVSKAIETVLGEEAQYVVSPGSYDQKHISRIGKLHNCIAYGPGILDLAHKPDEYIGVDDMIASAEIMVHSLAELLTEKE